MAGKIIADQLEHSTAGSVDTQFVVNGSAKAWTEFDGESTISINESFNTSSLTDNGTGRYQANLTNAFTNSNFAHHTTSQAASYNCSIDASYLGASLASIRNRNDAGTYVDVGKNVVTCHGGLA